MDKVENEKEINNTESEAKEVDTEIKEDKELNNTDEKETVNEEVEKEAPASNQEPEKENEENEIAGLKAEIGKLQEELKGLRDNSKEPEENNQVNTELNKQTGLVNEYEEILNGIIDKKIQDVPEEVKALIPKNISLKEKLDWINKAEKSGIFKQANPDIEIGKPLSAKESKQATDTSKLSASSILSMAYGNTKK